ncbi:MAG: tetratricopeptide repeat protein [Hyphomonadaceae bacterium]|nr:tetratricopeptide repeat protein [Hyphomonadaceae bacterium]
MNIRTAVAVSAFSLLGACASAPAPQLVDIAPLQQVTHTATPEILMARGYYDKAAIAYRTALVTKSDDFSSRYGLAEAERMSGKFDEAWADYYQLVDVAEWKARAVEGLGRVALSRGDRATALEKFNAVVADNPDAWQSWLAIAQIQDLDRQWGKADESYALALAASKEHAVVYNNHGVSMMARGEPVAAVALFRAAVAADSSMAHASTNLDLALAASGEPAVLDIANGDARDRARKLNNYGYVAMLQGRDEDAKRYYEAAVKEHPSFYALAFNNLKSLQSTEGRPQQ